MNGCKNRVVNAQKYNVKKFFLALSRLHFRALYGLGFDFRHCLVTKKALLTILSFC
jgi:hypothetical protein